MKEPLHSPKLQRFSFMEVILKNIKILVRFRQLFRLFNQISKIVELKT